MKVPSNQEIFFSSRKSSAVVLQSVKRWFHPHGKNPHITTVSCSQESRMMGHGSFVCSDTGGSPSSTTRPQQASYHNHNPTSSSSPPPWLGSSTSLHEPQYDGYRGGVVDSPFCARRYTSTTARTTRTTRPWNSNREQESSIVGEVFRKQRRGDNNTTTTTTSSCTTTRRNYSIIHEQQQREYHDPTSPTATTTTTTTASATINTLGDIFKNNDSSCVDTNRGTAVAVSPAIDHRNREELEEEEARRKDDDMAMLFGPSLHPEQQPQGGPQETAFVDWAKLSFHPNQKDGDDPNTGDCHHHNRDHHDDDYCYDVEY